ncbi:hypothetical protein R3P38DRAFT_2911440 [Favolaschia claudopus]|uniref:Uncharacterized protein n=1 Tax=Favolaschia claudopus TaxID=2862362 RepID=A0AAW0CCK7_9AGAR
MNANFSAVGPIPHGCVPVTHVVIDSSTVEIYDAATHGTNPRLRLFNMIPLACPDRHARSLPLETSSRTDLQLRDTRTDLSIIVFRRGFLSWAKSLLKWVPYASTAIGLFGLGECIWEWATTGVTVSGATSCVLGGITALYGIGGLAQANAAASLASAEINANFELVDVTRTWAQAGTQTEIVRRSRNPQFAEEYHAMLMNWTLPGAHHHSSGKPITLWDVARANSTHPITVHHAHRAFKANHSHAINVWSTMPNLDSGNPRLHFTVPIPHASTDDSSAPSFALESRQDPPGGGSMSPPGGGVPCVTIGEAEECVTPGGSVPPNAPGTMYYGFDLYGKKKEIEEYQADLGDRLDKENGFEPALVDMAEDIVARQAWDKCMLQAGLR